MGWYSQRAAKAALTGGSRRATSSPTPGDALVTRYNPAGHARRRIPDDEQRLFPRPRYVRCAIVNVRGGRFNAIFRRLIKRYRKRKNRRARME